LRARLDAPAGGSIEPCPLNQRCKDLRLGSAMQLAQHVARGGEIGSAHRS
jgi:hypothetical protein